MSCTGIIEELPRLTHDERQEIVERALALNGGWLDSDAPLAEVEKEIIEERFRDLDENPGASIPWDEAKAGLLARLKR